MSGRQSTFRIECTNSRELGICTETQGNDVRVVEDQHALTQQSYDLSESLEVRCKYNCSKGSEWE
jgi:hypothetical protein